MLETVANFVLKKISHVPVPVILWLLWFYVGKIYAMLEQLKIS